MPLLEISSTPSCTKAVQKDLNSEGFSRKIYKAYRSYSVTCQMFEMLLDTLYMGLPCKGSKHNRGIAFDLTLIGLKTKKELKMPTPFDALVFVAHSGFMRLLEEKIKNRDLLKLTMKKHGFQVDSMGWWHFNYENVTVFELLDIPFEKFDLRKTYYLFY